MKNYLYMFNESPGNLTFFLSNENNLLIFLNTHAFIQKFV